MEQFIELLREVNIIQIFIIFAGGWIFYNRLKNDLSLKIEKLESKFEKLEEKFEKLNDKVEDIDRRLWCIEGSLASHGHCLFNQAKPDQKAE